MSLFHIETDKENERDNFHKTRLKFKDVLSGLPLAPDLVHTVMQQSMPHQSWPCDTIGCRHEAIHFSGQEKKEKSLCILCSVEN